MSTVVMQPGGPGGGALWRAEKVCCRQAKRRGAVPKARLRKLVPFQGMPLTNSISGGAADIRALPFSATRLPLRPEQVVRA